MRRTLAVLAVFMAVISMGVMVGGVGAESGDVKTFVGDQVTLYWEMENIGDISGLGQLILLDDESGVWETGPTETIPPGGSAVIYVEHVVSAPAGRRKVTLVANQMKSRAEDSVVEAEIDTRELYIIVQGASLRMVGEPQW